MSTGSKNFENIILITGGGRGIGAAMAERLAQEERTMICITSRTQVELDRTVSQIVEQGGLAASFVCDVSDTESVRSMIDEIRENYGEVDVLVNNAGIGDGGPFHLNDPDQWWRMLEINLKGPMLLSNSVLKGMVEREKGVIINVSSFASIRSDPFTSAYGISKLGLNRLGECIADGYRDKNIVTFNISPGLVHTAMTDGGPFDDIPEEHWNPPSDAAELVAELVTGKYNRLSGRFIHVNYDLDEMLENIVRIEEESLYRMRMPTLDGIQK